MPCDTYGRCTGELFFLYVTVQRDLYYFDLLILPRIPTVLRTLVLLLFRLIPELHMMSLLEHTIKNFKSFSSVLMLVHNI